MLIVLRLCGLLNPTNRKILSLAQNSVKSICLECFP